MAILATILPIILVLTLFGIIVVLQIFLSRTESKLPGLVLPIISLLLSLGTTLGVASWYYLTPATYEESSSIEIESFDYEDSDETYDVSEDDVGGVSLFGNNPTEAQADSESSEASIFSLIMATAGIFLLSNIPTVILLAIYIVTRKRMNKEKHVNRTRIQDL